MNKRQLAQAIRDHKARQTSRLADVRITRKVMVGYPYSHNPYLPHEPVADCFSGCQHVAQVEHGA